jgi:phage-related protein
MFLITGPFPINNKQVFLPSPNEANTETVKSSVTILRMMNGEARTFVKRRKARKSFRWEFTVGRDKALELEDYVSNHSGSRCLISYKNQTYFGWLTLNPFEASGEIGEFFRITLEFEESK